MGLELREKIANIAGSDGLLIALRRIHPIAGLVTATWYEQGTVRVDDLVERVRIDLPGFSFARAALDDSGEDHAIVVFDGE